MNDGQVVVDFSGCRTRAEAMTKFSAWLDAHCIDQVRAHEARLLAEHVDPEEITAQTDQMLEFLAEERDVARKRFADILAEAGRP